MRRKITIYDIARISGYSPKTVSRVINGGKNVKESTYKSIRKIMEEYNYVPNIYARNLINKTNKNVLISVRKTSEYYPLSWFILLLEKIIIESKKYDMNVMVEYIDKENNTENSVINSSGGFIDTVVLFYQEKDDERIEALNKLKIPFIVFGKSDTEGVTYVSNDDYNSLYNLMKYLVGRGLKKVLLLMGDKSLVNLERARGAIDSYKEMGLEDDLIKVIYNLKTINDVYVFSKEYFKENEIPDAVFVSGDEKVIGLIHALNQLNISIPDDISVIGFDDIPTAAYYSPPLSTIAQDYVTLSKEIVSRLNKLVSGEHKLESIEVPTKLIIRNTTK